MGAQLAILRTLWIRGPSTVEQVRNSLEATTPSGYPTILKLLQIMPEKRLVVRDTRSRTDVHHAAVGEEARILPDQRANQPKRLGGHMELRCLLAGPRTSDRRDAHPNGRRASIGRFVPTLGGGSR
ncbi:MAG: hypothetical protein GF346_00480 [Candidatus Eisenbacteria bacterium]|nr:hypothetical protein [Candidatus Latescibacterota bacterium]MBD3300909.1 hypothetical protein [Candidatus Eisenbacteria bacterium]